MPEKQIKKSVLKKFFVSYEHLEIPCEAQKCDDVYNINFLIIYVISVF